jgi:hypothetical protein
MRIWATGKSRLFGGVFLALLTLSSAVAASPGKVRISSWYWLNAAPKAEWGRDFRHMSGMGFTDVVLAWGLDAAAFACAFRTPVRPSGSHKMPAWAPTW